MNHRKEGESAYEQENVAPNLFLTAEKTVLISPRNMLQRRILASGIFLSSFTKVECIVSNSKLSSTKWAPLSHSYRTKWWGLLFGK
ncbi:hypothetical protein V6N12_056286 [Hibiscus sabdariffa]|uniref:Uncharacterized protein n=1 Tax=Hibiscus sabdariffa TaxID=183260 RepID=A0ABR2CSI5_9ROSI